MLPSGAAVRAARHTHLDLLGSFLRARFVQTGDAHDRPILRGDLPVADRAADYAVRLTSHGG